MERLTLEKAKEINAKMVTEEHLILHAANVSAAMGAMAEHVGEDKEHWEAVGWLHDYDYEKYPEEHLAHTEEPLRGLGVPEEDIRAIAVNMMAGLAKKLEELGVTFAWDDDAVALVAKAGFDPIYGARPLRRTIRAKLEDPLSEKLLDGSVAAGKSVTATVENDEIAFRIQ